MYQDFDLDLHCWLIRVPLFSITNNVGVQVVPNFAVKSM